MALAAIEHPTAVHLLTDAVGLVQAAARLAPQPADPLTVSCLRALLVDLAVAADEAVGALARPAAWPGPRVVGARGDAGGGRTSDPGSLRLTTTEDGVRLAGRGPAPEGDLVRAALHRRAGGALAGSPAQEVLGEVLWSALVALSRDGLEPPTAVPTPLGLVGRSG